MIENSNASRNPSNGFVLNLPKCYGVGSVNVLAVNPSNAVLRLHRWPIPENADEPKYVTKNNEGKASARVRFLVEVEEMKGKLILPLDFWIRPDKRLNNDGTKMQIIDAYGRTAWATKTDISNKQVPTNADGNKAKIDKDYKPCHYGEPELVAFLMKYLNVTPLQVYNKEKQQYVDTEHPGRLTIDYWDKLCAGDVSEIREYLKLQKDNRVKIIFGIKTTEDNKSYQTFFTGDIKSGAFIPNNSRVDNLTGEFNSARKAIDKDRSYYVLNNKTYPYIYSAAPVQLWEEKATEVNDASAVEDLPDFEEADNLPFE